MADSPSSHPSPYRWAIRLGALLLAVTLWIRYTEQPRVHTAPRSKELTKINDIPPFSLTERSGRNITNQDLRGKIWVADFVYTTCPGPCPLITQSMAKLQTAVANDPRVQLVSFTVDPTDDTPAVLGNYADKFGASKDRWWFLTGPEKPLYSLIQNGFYQVVQDNRGQALEKDQFVVTHSTNLAVVDGNGVLRGSFDALSPEGRQQVLAAIATLEKESP